MSVPDVVTGKLKRYRVEADITISIATAVRARDAAHAIQLARLQELPTIMENGLNDPDPEDGWLTSGEMDGEPKNLTAELEDEE